MATDRREQERPEFDAAIESILSSADAAAQEKQLAESIKAWYESGEYKDRLENAKSFKDAREALKDGNDGPNKDAVDKINDYVSKYAIASIEDDVRAKKRLDSNDKKHGGRGGGW